MVAALFTGAAIYVGFAEQPARLGLAPPALLREWKPSYRRGAIMQGGLAMLGGMVGLLAGWLESDWRLIAGALLLLANWPFTLIVIKPLITRLMATAEETADAETRALIERWGRLHAVRTALGAAATLVLFWAAIT